jgi:glycerol-3-phosphate dehydrogenase
MDDLGPRLTSDLTGAELRYLVETEWAETADDVLWRRTKLGLKATADERIAINQFIVSLSAPSPRAPAQG